MVVSRREFAALSVAFAALPQDVLAQSTPQIADRIWRGGTVLTMNDAAMRAEAVAEKGGKIIAVGSLAQVMATRGPNTQIIDLKGRALLPGFFDAHGHVVMGGLQAMSANLLPEPDGKVKDIATLQQTLRDWMSANQEVVRTVNLVIGFGYDTTQLRELRHPNRDDLDAVSRDTPIMAVHQSGHIGALNTKALELMGFNAETKNPAGGVIQRRQGGNEPNGVVEESAFFTTAFKLVGSLGAAGLKAFAKSGAAMWARYGYTTAEEGRAVPASAEVIRQFADEGGFNIDVVAYADVLVDRDYIRKNVSRTYRNRYRLGGAKLTIDGSAQGFTAWRDRPFFAPVGDFPKGYAGYPAVTQKQINDSIDWAYANGIQIITHANGERASDALITATRAAIKKHGARANRRSVLIHGQLMREDQMAAYKTLNVTPSLFPMHTYYWGDWHRERTVGPALVDNISPTGWAHSRGMRFSTHHDAPVALPDSMRVLSATVSRRSRSGDIIGPAQRVDVITALKAMTIWPAWHHFEDTTKGSIEVGKLADFVVLSEDPTASDPEKLDRVRVAETIKEGATIFTATEADLRRTSTQDDQKNAAFGNFVRRAAIHQEIERLPESRRHDPVARAMVTAANHDSTCLVSFLSALASEMLKKS